MKLHLCCGDRYLDGYVNVDRVGTSSRRPKHKVTLETYYDHPLHENQEVIIDAWMDIEKTFSFEPESADEVVMISAIEHFSREAGEKIIEKVYTTLKYGGVFKFDFPDLLMTVLEYNDEYMVRLLYGSQKNDGAFHRWGYTENSIKKALMKHPWKSIEIGDIVKHDYPMIGVTATK